MLEWFLLKSSTYQQSLCQKDRHTMQQIRQAYLNTSLRENLAFQSQWESKYASLYPPFKKYLYIIQIQLSRNSKQNDACKWEPMLGYQLVWSNYRCFPIRLSQSYWYYQDTSCKVNRGKTKTCHGQRKQREDGMVGQSM